MTASLLLAALVALAADDAPPPPELPLPLPSAEHRLRLEPSLLVGLTAYNNLFEEREDGASTGVDTARTIGAASSLLWPLDGGEAIHVRGSLHQHRFQHFTASNHTELGMEVGFASAADALTAKASWIGEKLLFVTFRDEDVLHASRELSLSYERAIGKKLAIFGEAGWVGDEFVAPFDDRDSDLLSVALKVKFRPFRWLSPRIGTERGREQARSDNFSLSQRSLSCELALKPPGRLSLFSRLRYKDKVFGDAIAGQRNFGRRDRVRDVLVEARLALPGRLDLLAQGFFRRGTSTRSDRNFTARQLRLELQFRP